MKVWRDINLTEFEGWSGGAETLEDLTDIQKGIVQDYLEEVYPKGADETTINDFLWFERDIIAEDLLGYDSYEDMLEENKLNENESMGT